MSTAPAPQLKNDAYKKLELLITRSETAIAKRLPDILPVQRMIGDVLTTLHKQPKLLLCHPVSVLGTVVQAAELGLRLNALLGEAYMVPFWNRSRDRYDAQLQIGYRGFIALARRSGEVVKIEPRLAFDFDKRFEVRYGTDAGIVHEPNLEHPDYYRRDDNGDLIGLRAAYAVCTYKDGHDFEVCTLNRLQELRARSLSRDRDQNETGPWTTDPAAMYLKVPIRQLAKRLPLATDDGRFQKAATLDELGDADAGQNNGALIECDGEFADTVADVVRGQVQDLAAKHVQPRPQLPASHGARAYQGRRNTRSQQAAA